MDSANEKVAEADKRASALEKENLEMHKKLAQAKGSINVGNESSHTVSRDNTKSPPVLEEKKRESSNLRIRMDDTDSQLPHERSKSKISDR